MLRATLTQVADRTPRAKKAIAVIDISTAPDFGSVGGAPSLLYSIRIYGEIDKGEFKTTCAKVSRPLPVLSPMTALAFALRSTLSRHPFPTG